MKLLDDFLLDDDTSQNNSDNPEMETPDKIKPSQLSQKELPILPLRGLIVYPHTSIPLTIGQPRSIKLIDDLPLGDRIIGLVGSMKPDLENPNPEDLYQVGTAATIQRLFRAPDGTIRLLIEGLYRFQITNFTNEEPYLKANIQPIPEIIEAGIEIDALVRNVRETFAHNAKMIPSIPGELVNSIVSIDVSLQIAYTISNFQRMEVNEAQHILEIDSTFEKLRQLLNILTRESEVLELGQKIQDEARSEIDKMQRDYFLREQMKAIQRELGEKDDQKADIDEFRHKIVTAKMSEEAETLAMRELDRMERIPSATAEYGVIRTFLDWLVSLPWSNATEDNLDLGHADSVLNEDHYGLADVKERIIEFLAVRRLRGERRQTFEDTPAKDQIRKEREGVILCFVGPPGVGKTSLGQSIARALGREFIRISLGGVHDEAEIRGHRRTYIGAMPGRIVQALRRVKTNNPVFMLDEIDKLGADFRGDPGSALLEVLDPEQNDAFRDNYLEVPFDLSQVMFITTANQLETIPAPLMDRMEIIRIAGYTENEKISIATNYLFPRQLRENGLRLDEISFSEAAIQTIIRNYTREAGVRELDRKIGALCRKAATNLLKGSETPFMIDVKDVKTYLGRQQYFGNEEIAQRTSIPGVATGLAWTPVGGDVLFVEASKMPGDGGFRITGSIGQVMQESAQAALTYVRSHAKELEIDHDLFKNSDLHLHVPAGAQPKDGPSAGITMATALVSLLLNKNIRCDLGMTGEITLRGQVMPVGGIKEKSLAAHRAGIKTIIIPKRNEPDLEDIIPEIREQIAFKPVETIEEVLEIAFSDE
jgi:ATP-dependent Lon protease